MQRHTLNAALLATTAFALAGALPDAVAEETPTLFVTTQSASIDCTGHDVNVASANAKLTFTGRCKGLYFVGSGTTATIESAELVQVSGDGMRLGVKGKLVDAHLIGNRGEFTFDEIDTLHLNGDDLRVDARAIGKISAIGSRNTTRWMSGEPLVDDIGSGNVLQPKS